MEAQLQADLVCHDLAARACQLVLCIPDSVCQLVEALELDRHQLVAAGQRVAHDSMLGLIRRAGLQVHAQGTGSHADGQISPCTAEPHEMQGVSAACLLHDDCARLRALRMLVLPTPWSAPQHVVVGCSRSTILASQRPSPPHRMKSGTLTLVR